MAASRGIGRRRHRGCCSVRTGAFGSVVQLALSRREEAGKTLEQVEHDFAFVVLMPYRVLIGRAARSARANFAT